MHLLSKAYQQGLFEKFNTDSKPNKEGEQVVEAREFSGAIKSAFDACKLDAPRPIRKTERSTLSPLPQTSYDLTGIANYILSLGAVGRAVANQCIETVRITRQNRSIGGLAADVLPSYLLIKLAISADTSSGDPAEILLDDIASAFASRAQTVLPSEKRKNVRINDNNNLNFIPLTKADFDAVFAESKPVSRTSR